MASRSLSLSRNSSVALVPSCKAEVSAAHQLMRGSVLPPHGATHARTSGVDVLSLRPAQASHHQSVPG